MKIVLLFSQILTIDKLSVEYKLQLKKNTLPVFLIFGVKEVSEVTKRYRLTSDTQ